MKTKINKKSLNNKLRLLKNSIIYYNKDLINKIEEVGGISPLIYLKKFQNLSHLLGSLSVIYDLYAFLCKIFDDDLTIKDIYSLYQFNMSNSINNINNNNINKDYLNDKLINSKHFDEYLEFLKSASRDKTLFDFLNNKY